MAMLQRLPLRQCLQLLPRPPFQSLVLVTLLEVKAVAMTEALQAFLAVMDPAAMHCWPLLQQDLAV